MESAIISPVIWIIAATLMVALTTIALAAQLSFRVFAQSLERMVSLSIGILLATTFLHLLPEAFESGQPAHHLFALMLAGILAFFFLEKVALYRHSHHYEGDGHHHEHGHDAREAGDGGALILVGSAFHNFSDGVLIAGAYLAGPWIGMAATLSIFTHEVPHKIGDFVVLLNAGITKRRALFYATISSMSIVVGGLTGFFLLAQLRDWIPFVLVVAASNFIYISLSDLVPRMQRDRAIGDAISQGTLIAFGIVLVLVLNDFSHAHGH